MAESAQEKSVGVNNLNDNKSAFEQSKESGPNSNNTNHPLSNDEPSEYKEVIIKKDCHGMAAIKKQYLDTTKERVLVENFLSKDDATSEKKSDNVKEGDGEDGPPKKKQKVKGRNKQRPHHKRVNPADRLCTEFVKNGACNYGEKCKYTHDIEGYMSRKPPDLGDTCYMFETYGNCPYGIVCRFAKSHITEDYKNIVVDKEKTQNPVLNQIPKDVQMSLWKNRYDFQKANSVIKSVREVLKDVQAPSNDSGSDERMKTVPIYTLPKLKDEEGIALRPQEKKKIDFRDKLYLAPLTTVGNLPFRRLCKDFGVDITCGEMALATNLLRGQASEWALFKRHPSEDIFGAQICGGHLDSMTRVTQLITDISEVDFIDINCGCPIDLVFRKGEGSALIGRHSRMRELLTGMTAVTHLPITVKLRVAINEGKNIAHTLIPKLRDWGASLVTLHGRSREQRYTKLADWKYIETCAQAADPLPLFGNGDILTYEDYNERRQSTSVAGCMVARGALIKPWIFTEIKEQRHWDISASERFDMLRRFTNYGLEHWGSDQQGVDNTRRFLLEWLSFLYRYIPVGVMERLPQKIHEKPPYYFGRNDLETLMASSHCGDWIKISEMLLGPVPDNFEFLPKHKANAYK